MQIHEYHHFNRVISSKVNSTLQLSIHSEERRSAQPTSTLFRSYKMKMEDVSVEKRVRKTNSKSGVLLCGVRSSRSNWRLHTERLCQQLNQPQNHKKYPHFRLFLLLLTLLSFRLPLCGLVNGASVFVAVFFVAPYYPQCRK